MLKKITRLSPLLGLVLCVSCADDSGGGGEATRLEGSMEWVLTYSGAREGEVSGSITTYGRLEALKNTTVVCSDFDLVELSSPITITLHEYGDEYTASIRVFFEDGPSCSAAVEGHGVDVVDVDKDTFHAIFEGTLNCSSDGEPEPTPIAFKLVVDRA